MKGDTSKAVEFLKAFYPKGPWVLTCIDPSKKGIETASFTLDQRSDMRDWIDHWNGHRNIYFSVAEPMQASNKKLERTDIKRVWYLHVDVDPRAGEDLASEQKRAKALVTTNLPEGVPEPTFTLFSGGGYQAFWRLKEPIVIDGSLEKAEDAKLWNVQLERLFGADNVHNIDRIMRLAGTVNIPDAKKRAKGRTEALAELLSCKTDLVYALEAFQKAQPVQTPGVTSLGGGNAIKVEVSGNVARLDSVEDLNEWDVKDRVKVIIVQGHDIDNPKESDNSRSAWLFDCCCQLVRAGVPDEIIYSIITDPDFLISESVLDKGSNTEKYALKNIQKAKEYAIDPALKTLNEQHAVILNWGGKVVVVEEIEDSAFAGRPRLTKQSFDNFRNRYLNRRVKIGENDKGDIFMPMGKWWLEHAERRQYRTLVFAPGRETPEDYNLWRGFNVESRPGDCSLFLSHLKENIAKGDQGYYEYLLGWMAQAVQRPASAGQIAVVLRGGQGTGKSFFAKTFGNLFGRHFLHISNSSHLVGNFNAHLRDCVLLFADEAFYAGDKRHESVLKMLITEETLVIEAKGVDVEQSPNYTHIIMASNNQWVVPAGADERRYFVLDVGDKHKQDSSYFQAIADQMTSGGYEALLHTLLSFDISNFNVRNVPQTEALGEQKEMSLSPEEEWWYDKLCQGSVLRGHTGWEMAVVKDDLFDDHIAYSRDTRVFKPLNKTTVGIFLGRILPGIFPRKKRLVAVRSSVSGDGYQIEQKKQLAHYVLPGLEECRAHWDHMFGKQKWDPVEQDESDPEPEVPF